MIIPARSRPVALPVHPGRVRLLWVLALALLLSACKIVILVPPGGKVVSASGEECLAGQTCVIDVSHDNYENTFTAVPDAGHAFAGWERDQGYFCGGKQGDCYLATTGFTGNAGLMAVLASDREFFLVPRFTPARSYNWAYWKRIVHQLDNRSWRDGDVLYANDPIPAQCDPGTLTAGARERALRALNETRALHDLPPVEYDANFDTQMQLASLVQRANEYLSHTPSPGDTCYSAEAEMGAGSANLTGSSGGVSDPAGDVFGWTNDSNNVAVLMEAGHRRWVLYPELGYTAYGQVDGYAAQKVFGFHRAPAVAPDAELAFVAMPYGTYPYILMSRGARPTPWSLSMVPPRGDSSPFDYFAGAEISVVEKRSGEALRVHSQHRDTRGFGLANFLSWIVDDWDYDTTYTVTVRNISLPTGELRTVRYSVRVDRFNLFSVDRPLEAGDGIQGASFGGDFDSAFDEDSYRVALSGRVSFNLSPGFFLRIYNAGKQLVVSSDTDFSRQFSAGNYTLLVSPCDEDGLCYQGVTGYNGSFQ